MAYSFEGVSTHPNLRLKRKPLYIDKHGNPCHRIHDEEGIEKAYGMIKNREPLQISSSEEDEWSIASIICMFEK